MGVLVGRSSKRRKENGDKKKNLSLTRETREKKRGDLEGYMLFLFF